jgi:phosphorylase kinase gamma subunit
VRKCLEKASEVEYAVKIIDLTQEKDNNELTEEMRRETKREIEILRKCSQHPNISKLMNYSEQIFLHCS